MENLQDNLTLELAMQFLTLQKIYLHIYMHNT